MLKELVKLANHLDSRGLVKEADHLDRIIRNSGLWNDLKGAWTGTYNDNPLQESGEATEIGPHEYVAQTPSAYEEGSEADSDHHDRSTKDADDAAAIVTLLTDGPTGTPEDGRLLSLLHTSRGKRSDVVNLDDPRVKGMIRNMSDAYSKVKRFPQVHSFIFDKQHRANTYSGDKGRLEQAAGPLREHQNA
jgi:hypothetical protein